MEPEGLSSSSYADVSGRQFPVHTKAACYVSALYFAENKNRLPNWRQTLVSSGINKAAEQHGILADIQNIVHRNGELAKEAATINSNDYMVPNEQQYPLRNSEEVKAAAHYLDTFRTVIPLEDRMGMASRVLEKAAAFEMYLGDHLNRTLQKYAGLGTCDPSEVADQLSYRSKIAQHESVKKAWSDLGSYVNDNPGFAMDGKALREMAVTIDNLDRQSGIKYGSLVKAPEEFLFGIVFKEACDTLASTVGTATGNFYMKNQLSALSKDDVSEMWGEKAASDSELGIKLDTEKLATIVSSLPWRDAIIFDWKMQELGCEPVRKMSIDMDISVDERRRLAAEYAATP
jgi:hypothetical protein